EAIDELFNRFDRWIDETAAEHNALFESEMDKKVAALLDPNHRANTVSTKSEKYALYNTWDTGFHGMRKNLSFYVDGRVAKGHEINYYAMGMLMKHRGMGPTRALSSVKLYKLKYLKLGWGGQSLMLSDNTSHFFWRGYNEYPGRIYRPR
ncbi:MAG: hypothetical protein WC454_08790, partial [Phycisphaerae bacterium]